MSMEKKRIDELSIGTGASLFEAMERMDKADCKLLMVRQGEAFAGLVSIGDIQRSILANRSLSTSVSSVIRSDILFCKDSDPADVVKSIMLANRCEFMPIVDDSMRLVRVIAWEELFESPRLRNDRHVPVVIMAGGLGLRLRPLTNVIPKPLIPVGERTILEQIIDNFSSIGSRDFFLSVNYKSGLIEYYLSTLELGEAKVDFIREDSPLGTIGALRLLRDRLEPGPFFVTNCDILVQFDYNAVLDHHLVSGNAITIVSAMKRIDIPYGVLRFSDGGALRSIDEKPSQSYAVSTGLYVIDREAIDLIDEGEALGFPDLAARVMEKGGTVGVFPISEGSWFDIGNWDEYERTLREAKGS
jgi:dTDP-glucose pyrophosphorylase